MFYRGFLRSSVLVNDENFPNRIEILKAFTRFTYEMHEKQIHFLDHSAGNTLIVQTEKGNGISGRLSGFATSDELIAGVVSSMQNHAPFDIVRMDFSRSRTVRGFRARGFRISFLIELDQAWQLAKRTAFVGGDE